MDSGNVVKRKEKCVRNQSLILSSVKKVTSQKQKIWTESPSLMCLQRAVPSVLGHLQVGSSLLSNIMIHKSLTLSKWIQKRNKRCFESHGNHEGTKPRHMHTSVCTGSDTLPLQNYGGKKYAGALLPVSLPSNQLPCLDDRGQKRTRHLDLPCLPLGSCLRNVLSTRIS